MASCELDGSNDPHWIFLQPDVRVADCPNDSSLDVIEALDVVDDLPTHHIIEETVDGEIAAQGVFVWLPKDVVSSEEKIIGVASWVTAEGRHLDNLAVTKEHMSEAKSSADDSAVAKEFFQLCRPSARGDIEVLRLAAEKEISHAATDEEGFMAMSHDATDDLHGVGVEVCQGNRLSCDDWFWRWRRVAHGENVAGWRR